MSCVGFALIPSKSQPELECLGELRRSLGSGPLSSCAAILFSLCGCTPAALAGVTAGGATLWNMSGVGTSSLMLAASAVGAAVAAAFLAKFTVLAFRQAALRALLLVGDRRTVQHSEAN